MRIPHGLEQSVDQLLDDSETNTWNVSKPRDKGYKSINGLKRTRKQITILIVYRDQTNY